MYQTVALILRTFFRLSLPELISEILKMLICRVNSFLFPTSDNCRRYSGQRLQTVLPFGHGVLGGEACDELVVDSEIGLKNEKLDAVGQQVANEGNQASFAYASC